MTLSRDHWKLHLDRGMWKKGVNGTALHFLLCIHSTFISHKGCSSQALHCFILTVVLNQLHFTDTVNKKNCERECPESGAVKNPSSLYFCLICSPFFPRNDKEQTPCSTAWKLNGWGWIEAISQLQTLKSSQGNAAYSHQTDCPSSVQGDSCPLSYPEFSSYFTALIPTCSF